MSVKICLAYIGSCTPLRHFSEACGSGLERPCASGVACSCSMCALRIYDKPETYIAYTSATAMVPRCIATRTSAEKAMGLDVLRDSLAPLCSFHKLGFCCSEFLRAGFHGSLGLGAASSVDSQPPYMKKCQWFSYKAASEDGQVILLLIFLKYGKRMHVHDILQYREFIEFSLISPATFLVRSR